jgi:hypothetical protein
MFVTTYRQPTSRQPRVSTHINNCLTVEFNALPRFLFSPGHLVHPDGLRNSQY